MLVIDGLPEIWRESRLPVEPAVPSPTPPLENQQTRVIEAIVYASILPRDLTFPVPWKSVVHTSSHNDPEHYPGYCQSEPLGSKYCIKERLNQYEGE